MKNGYLAVSYSNNQLNIIDFKNGEIIKSETLQEDVNYLALLNSDKLIGMTSKNEIKIWNSNNLTLIKTFYDHTSKIKAFCLLPNGQVAVATYSKIKIWDPIEGKVIKAFGNYAKRNVIVLLNDNKIASSNLNNLEIYNLKNFRKSELIKAHTLSISSLAVLKNGDLVSGSYDKLIKVWNTKEGISKTTLVGHNSQICVLATLNDGNLASGSADNTIKIWDVVKGTLLKTLYGHSDWVRCLTVIFEDYLASGSIDKSIRIWNLKEDFFERTIHNSLQLQVKKELVK
jgi:WD40 repeat protein